jgi:flagellar biosynthesis anti-sigma factor FlgM
MVDSISGGAATPGRPALQPVGQREAPAPAAAVQTERPAQSTLRAAADSGASGVSQLRELGASAPVDSARVADLRARIASGSYQIDPEATAAAMVRSELGGSAG